MAKGKKPGGISGVLAGGQGEKPAVPTPGAFAAFHPSSPSPKLVRVGVRFMLPEDRTVWQVMPGTTARMVRYGPVDARGIRVDGPVRVMPLGAMLEQVKVWM